MTLEIMTKQARGALGRSGAGKRSAFAANNDLRASDGSKAHPCHNNTQKV